jgi:hypothetical protein
MKKMNEGVIILIRVFIYTHMIESYFVNIFLLELFCVMTMNWTKIFSQLQYYILSNNVEKSIYRSYSNTFNSFAVVIVVVLTVAVIITCDKNHNNIIEELLFKKNKNK